MGPTLLLQCPVRSRTSYPSVKGGPMWPSDFNRLGFYGHLWWKQAMDIQHRTSWADGLAAARVLVDAPGSHYHCRLCGCLECGQLPENMLVSEEHTDLGGLSCHQGHGDVLNQVAAKCHVWVSQHSYKTWDHWPGVASPTLGQVLSCQSTVKTILHKHDCKPIWSRQFFN